MITIRLSAREDVLDLQNLNNEVFIDNAKYDSDLDLAWAKGEKGKASFMELLSDPRSLCLVAEDGKKKIGYLAAGPKEIDYRKRRYFEIHSMGVIPAYRSKGIGRLLLEKCFEWAKAEGYQSIFVNAYIKNDRAVDFYKDAGFSEIDISLERPL